MKDLTKDLSISEILRLWFPLVISGLFGQSYGLINTVIVSRYLSSEAVAVMGACSPYRGLQSYIFAGVTTGIGLVVCRKMERKNYKLFKKTILMATTISLILVGFAFCCIPFIYPLMKLIHVPEEMQQPGYGYMLFLIFGAIALTGKNLLVTILNGMGEMKMISIMSVIGILTNSIFAITFIAGLKTQVWGSSCAIFISDFILFLIYLFYFIRQLKKYRRECDLKVDLDSTIDLNNEDDSSEVKTTEMFFAGIAKPIMMGMVAVGSFFYQDAYNQMSSEVIAGMSYANTITNIFMDPLCSVALLSAAIYAQSAHNIKANKDIEIICSNRKKLKIICYIWSAICIICIMIFSAALIGVLAEQGAAQEIIEKGSFYLNISIWGFPGLALYLLNRAALHAVGKNIYLPLFGLLEMLAAIIAVVVFVPRYGFISLPIAVLVKWIVPGIVSEIIMKAEKIG